MTVRPYVDFLQRQRVYDQFRDAEAFLREHEKVIAVHPDDLTDEMRALILATPLTTLRESKHLTRGTLFVISPGLLADLGDPALITRATAVDASEHPQPAVTAEDESPATDGDRR